jgi:hypothetical protein
MGTRTNLRHAQIAAAASSTRRLLARQAASNQISFEPLEDRRLYSVTTTLVNRHVEIVSDSAADTITIDHNFHTVFVNGHVVADDALLDQGGIQIHTGGGDDVINLLGAGVPVTIQSDSGNPTVFIGKHGNAQDIHKAVSITNTAGNTGILIDDSNDVVGQVVTMDVRNGVGTITGLAPGVISYNAAHTSALEVEGGDGGNEFTILNTLARPDLPGFAGTSLASGHGADLIHVKRTSGPISIDGQGAGGGFGDAVELGDSAVGALGSTGGINGAVGVTDSGGPLFVSLNDGRDSGNHTVTVTSNSVTGASPAPIFYSGLVGLSQPVEFDVTTGAGADTYNIQSLSAGNALHAFAGAGNDTFNVGSVNGTLDPVLGGMLLDGEGGGVDQINLNDQSSAVGRSFTLSRQDFPSGGHEMSVDRAGAGSIIVRASNLTINGGGAFGSPGNVFNVNDTLGGNGPVNTTINSGFGIDTVNVTGTTGTLLIDGENSEDTVNLGQGNTQSIKGAVTVRNDIGHTALNIDDSVDTIARTITLATSGPVGTITGVAPAKIAYFQADISTMSVTGGSGGNTFNVADTYRSGAAVVGMTLNTGAGADTVNVQRTTVPLTINGQSGRDTVNVGLNGSMQAINGDLTVTNTSSFTNLSLFDQANGAGHPSIAMDAPSQGQGIIVGLARGAVHYNTGDIGALSINTGSGADNFTVFNTARNAGPASTTINTNGGSDSVVVRGTNGPLNLNLGAGNDTVSIGSAFNTLDPIQGDVKVDGGADFDTLTASDQGSVTPHVYTTNGNVFTRSGAASISFANTEVATLKKGVATSGFGTSPLIKNVVFPTTITAGQTATLTGQLADPDAGATVSLLINWGDGSAVQKSTPNLAPFSLSHKFTKAGTYAVRVTWIDNTGRANHRDLALTVKSA